MKKLVVMVVIVIILSGCFAGISPLTPFLLRDIPVKMILHDGASLC